MAHTETDELKNMVNDFAESMQYRLLLKAKEGFSGWNDTSNRRKIEKALLEIFESGVNWKQPKKLIDAGTLLAILYYLHQNDPFN